MTAFYLMPNTHHPEIPNVFLFPTPEQVELVRTALSVLLIDYDTLDQDGEVETSMRWHHSIADNRTHPLLQLKAYEFLSSIDYGQFVGGEFIIYLVVEDDMAIDLFTAQQDD